uniref:Protein OSB1 mitochondrial n=1 Tax=Zea mays TaxID=4577 RepID=B6T7E2_MAIZE|nr:hypothetical protein [Zea mays]|eukprot:NP_001143553.1 uncharacterized protein LOC100276246 [Zea mays]
MLRRLVGGAAAVRSPLPPPFCRLLHNGGGGGGCSSGEPESVAYRMSMLRRPSTVSKKGLTWNWCSLIGRLAAPVRPIDTSFLEVPRAYTFLSVTLSSPAPSSSSSNINVTLQLNGELANVGLKHLKHDDLVYVSGHLGSYHKVSPSGERHIVYKIYVRELNYVVDQNKKPQNDADSTSPPSMTSVTLQMLKENECIGRLRLWQVFFANPYEWWDNRRSKPCANYPDFKHKDTREKIWLRPDDPPWVRKQLELYDLEVAENGHRCKSRLSKKQNWKTQDFDYFDDEEVQHLAEA